MDFGSLQRLDPREGWKNEAVDFTPWLANNIELLGEALGLNLRVEMAEKPVGPFSADILCQDLDSEEWVVVENQLEKTDHSHLGQLLTCAAGLEASTIVWVARDFTEEHRAALDWLNQNTRETVRFFGIQIEL